MAKNANPKKKLPKNWRREFLRRLGQSGVISHSAKAAGVSIHTVAPEPGRVTSRGFGRSCGSVVRLALRAS